MLLFNFIVHMLTMIGVSIYIQNHSLGLEANMMLGQMSIVIPALGLLIYFFCTGKEGGESLTQRLGFHKVKGTVLIMTVVYAFLMMPLTTLVNAVSMLFVDNTIQGMSTDILSLPFLLSLFLIAAVPALNEELVFRGMVYGGYRKTGRIWPAIFLSALAFGLMHMNVNQALYAFVLGIAMAALYEAAGSIWATMLFHFSINAWSCIVMFVSDRIMPGMLAEEASMSPTAEELTMVIAVYFVIAAVTTPIAICVLYWIAKQKGRTGFLMAGKNRKQRKAEDGCGEVQSPKEKIVTVPFVLFVICTLGLMIYQEVMIHLVK